MLRTMRRYNLLCDIADKLLGEYQPCKGCKGCSVFPSRNKPNKPYDCCEGCPFNGPQGCTTRCLACKLWLCYNTPGLVPDMLLNKLHRIEQLARKLNIHYARSTPEEALGMTEQKSVWFFYEQGRR